MLLKANDQLFSNAITQLRIDQNSLLSLEKGLSSLSDSLETTNIALQEWESANKLSANVGKAGIKATRGTLNTAVKSLVDTTSKFDKILEELSLLNSKDKEGVKLSKATFIVLDKAEKGARKAEAKLIQAKAVGAKEAGKYLKKAAKIKAIVNAASTPSKAG